MHSLLRYVASPAFAPKAELEAGLLRKLLLCESRFSLPTPTVTH